MAEADDDTLTDVTAREPGAGGNGTSGAPGGAKAEVTDDDDFFPIEVDGEGRPIQAEGDERLGSDDQQRQRARRPRAEQRAARREARDRDKQRIDALERENNELKQRVGRVEHGQVTQTAGDIDAEIENAIADFRQAEADIETASTNNDGKALVMAMRRRDAAFVRGQRLDAQKANLAQLAHQRTDARPSGSDLSEDAKANARAWRQDNPWFDPKGGDEDSRIVSMLDKALMREGYDPASNDYWDELDRRVARRLPHLNEDGEGARQDQRERPTPEARPLNGGGQARRAGPPVGGGGGARGGAGAGGVGVYVSPERKQAMIESGSWEDPAKRKSMLKRYAAYDKEHGITHGGR